VLPRSRRRRCCRCCMAMAAIAFPAWQSVSQSAKVWGCRSLRLRWSPAPNAVN